MTMEIKKMGVTLPVSLELLSMYQGGPTRKGEYRETPLTRKDYREYARAAELLEEIESNPWIEYDDYEGFYLKEFEPEREFLPTETLEEYHERLREWAEG